MWNIISFIGYLRCEKAYSNDTLLAYQNDIEQFFIFADSVLKVVGPEEISTNDVREWVMSLSEKGYTSTSINRKLSSLRAYYRYLMRKGDLKNNPLRKIIGPKKEKPIPSFVKEKEMDRLLDEISLGDGFKGVRDKLIIEMFYLTGIRLSELIGLNVNDVDFFGRTIKVNGKRKKQRLIPFDEELRQSIENYLDIRSTCEQFGEPAFFIKENGERINAGIVSRLVKRALSKVSTIKKKSPHVLRHTFATTMLNHDADLGVISRLLGHESLSTTEIYTHTTFEELKKTYKQAHPRA